MTRHFACTELRVICAITLVSYCVAAAVQVQCMVQLLLQAWHAFMGAWRFVSFSPERRVFLPTVKVHACFNKRHNS